MSLSAAVIDALVAAGATVEQLAAAVKADMAEAEQRLADKRAKDAERQRRHRKSRNVTVTPRDDADAPPYEDTSTPPPPTATKVASGGKRKRATSFPIDFTPQTTGKTQAVVDGWPPGRLEDELQSFRDHHTAKGTLSYDWQANWRTWVTNSKRWEPRNGLRQRQSDTLRGNRPDPALDMWREAQRELAAERGDQEPGFGTRPALPAIQPH